ncbi:hypothetical protein [Photobacterium leiognathi]|uniref:hypothetical protein n=1 Tax=Photobacterium leiognathi TaxID=553611 RepID=UPI002981C607|nr:hypothetical protein [Photobacterium leiognathi]
MENKNDIQVMAQELLDIKRQIKKLLNEEKYLKDEIKPLLKESGAIKFTSGKIYYAESKASSTFNRREVLTYIRDNYGDALADQIDEDCTKIGSPRQTVYIKLYE